MQRQFNIRLWFGLTGFAIIGLIWATTAYLFTDFLTRSLLERESEVSQEFLQGIVDVEGADLFLRDIRSLPTNDSLIEFSQHVVNTPGVIRANIYSADRKVVWSTENQLIGKTYEDNSELTAALNGKRSTEVSSIDNRKAEHVAFQSSGLFIEAYMPMYSRGSDRHVVGVVELYKFPTELNHTIAYGRQIIWMSGLAAAVLAYLTLYWIVQRGAKVIESQQIQLRNMQSSALIGELASAVAHSLRNPMAGIRSSAELWRSELPPGQTYVADDVIHEVDRMNEYVHDLLNYARSDKSQLQRVDPMSQVETVLTKREAALRRNKIVVRRNDSRIEPSCVNADPILLEHALTSVITNAIEAMPDGGVLGIAISNDGADQSVITEISDTGPGISADMIGHVTESYFTTKSKGLGLGLALARGVIERWAGTVSIRSSKESGTTVTVTLKKA